MPWYRSGTVSVTNGSAVVTGTGTTWMIGADEAGASVGEAFYGPDGRTYEILSLQSATQFTLGSPYQGATLSGQSYQIIPTQSYLTDLSIQVGDLITQYSSVANSQGVFADGTGALPGMRFANDLNTGIRRVGEDLMALVTGSVDRLAIGSTGNIGIDAAKRLYMDGTALTGDTYLAETSANVLDFIVGAANTLRLTASAAAITGALTVTGAVSASNLSGTNTGDQTNVTGQAGYVANYVTFNAGGAGDAAGAAFNGSAAKTISYNTIGAPSVSGANASGTWPINVTGIAGQASNLQGASGIVTYGASGAEWSNFSGVGGAGTNGAALSNPTNDWFHHLTFNHGNGLGYYVDFALCFHSDTFAIRRVASGSDFGWRTLLHSGNYNSYSPTLTGTGASGTWGINITGSAAGGTSGNAATASQIYQNNEPGAGTYRLLLGNASDTNGEAYNFNALYYNTSGSIIQGANVSGYSVATGYYHSGRDFPLGTYIETDIAVDNGDPWLLHITGNAYATGSRPVDIRAQGYNYGPGTYFNGGATSNGTNIANISVFRNSGGYLCFWFASQGYWAGYDVRCIVANGTYTTNRVTNITNAAKPGSITLEVVFTPIQSASTAAANTFTAVQYVSNGDNSYTQYGPNSSWGAYLRVGSGANLIDTSVAAVISTDGNLHLDSASNGPKALYLNYYSNGPIYAGSGQYNVLHAGNYNSYALPLSGGTLTGTVKINTTGSASSTSHVIIKRSGAGDPASFGSYSGLWRSGIEIWNNDSTLMMFLNPPETNSLYANLKAVGGGLLVGVGTNGSTTALQIESNGASNFPGSLTVGGNTVLNASNYNSYAPTLTGTGASGTWGISITGAPGGDYTNGNYRVYADYAGTSTWYIRSSAAQFIWARAHDWSQSFSLSIAYGTADANSAWALLGQQQSNTAQGTWFGVRIMQYAGSAAVDGYLRAARYYLGDDTNYMTAGSTGAIRSQTAYGYLDIGAQNSSYAHLQTDRPSFYVNKPLYVDGEIYRYTGGHLYLHVGNYNSYAPTLTGTGASGTWGINITGNAGNASSISNAVGGAYAWTNEQYFNTNGGNIAGASGGTLQAYSNGGSGHAALMSFHRSGIYGVMLGLDTDNVMKIGGWSMGAVAYPILHTGNYQTQINFTSAISSNYLDANSPTSLNAIGYVAGNISLFGQTDGGLYSSAYGSSWYHQIFGDFRTGQIAVRGKNNGSWQSWRTVLDSSNYTSYPTFGNNVQKFTGNGTWTKPSGYSGSARVRVQVWGGGGGSTGGSLAGGGGGGGYNEKWFDLSTLGATETVTIGAGGDGQAATATAGGNTTFGSHVTGYGGGPGLANAVGGGGGGTGAGASNTAGSGHSTGDAGGLNASSTLGGGGGNNYSPGGNGYGSYYGGGGGAGGQVGNVGGTSQFGGAGGARQANGVQPGGGAGGLAANDNVGRDGGAGQCIVTVYGV